jgi:Uma2 family endonuclease
MSAVPKARLTPEQYLAIERKAEFKSEFYNGEMFAMAGASEPHNRIKDNLVGELYIRLKGSGCHSYSSDMRVKVSATGLYTYPDVVIVCSKPQLEDAELDTLLNPQIIIEVQSESTASYVGGKKFRQYQQIETFREYVLVAQDEPVVERFVRQPDKTWVHSFVEGLDREFDFATVPVRIPLANIYAGVEFTQTRD